MATAVQAQKGEDITAYGELTVCTRDLTTAAR
jgi:hypothetical protein